MPRVCIADRTALVGLCILTALVLSLPGVAAQSTVWTEDARLLADDGASGDRFGNVVAQGNIVLVGAPGVDGDPTSEHDTSSSGAVYVLDATTGQQLRKIPAPVQDRSEFFGSRVALEGDTALINATFADLHAYDINTGNRLSTFGPSDPEATSVVFGGGLAFSGNLALTGASFVNLSNQSIGRAYLFDLSDPSQPTQVAMLEADAVGIFRDNSFGGAIALQGNTALIGSRGDEGDGFNAGAAYLFDLTDPANPVRLSRFTPSDPSIFNLFGGSVAIDGNVAFVGSFNPDPNIGSAIYVFDISDPTSPSEVAKITPPSQGGSREGRFTDSMSVDYGYLLVGDGQNASGAYLYDISDLSNIVEIAKLAGSDVRLSDVMGVSVALSHKTAFVGAFQSGNGVTAPGTGTVYLFNVPEPSGAAALLIGLLATRRRRQISCLFHRSA